MKHLSLIYKINVKEFFKLVDFFFFNRVDFCLLLYIKFLFWGNCRLLEA